MLGTQTSITRNDDVQHYQRQAPQHDNYHQPQQKSMNDMVEFEDENGQVRLVPRHIAMGVPGVQHVGSFARPSYWGNVLSLFHDMEYLLWMRMMEVRRILWAGARGGGGL